MSHGPESALTKWLKKYKYVNIALIYLGTALVVIHFAEAVVHGLHMPAITFTLIVVLALAGLPIVLLIAWATSNKKTESAGDTVEPKAIKRNWAKIITASVLSIALFAAAIFVYNKFFYQSKFTGKEKSIAVLPFTNMSSDKENEYFSDGITEEIYTQLSKISELIVIDPNSAKLFKDSKKSIKEIASELGVSSLCKGSVRKEGNDIRITAQLIDANTQEQIWADTWDRTFKEVFAIQSEVAKAIAYQLNANLTKEEKNKIEKRLTNNPLAYQYFIQAGQMRDRFHQTMDTNYFLNSKELFEKAISLDTNYSLVHAGLAHLFNTYTNLVKDDSLLNNAQVDEINKAYALSPDNDYINTIKGTIYYTVLKKPEEAFGSFKKAITINPNNTNTLYELGIFLSVVGLYEDRIKLLEKAVKLDPLNEVCYGYLGGAEVHLNRLNEGLSYMETALKLSPDMFYIMDRIAYVYALRNNLNEIPKWLNKFWITIPEQRKERFLKVFGQYSAYCYAKLGDKSKALELSKNWRVYLALSLKEEAITQLIAEHKNGNSMNYLQIKAHLPHKDFDIIRHDPRFLELMEKKRLIYEENKNKFNIAGMLN